MSPAERQSLANAALMAQLLTWVDERPRTYAQAMEAWRTACPRMPIWEDAVSDGLIERLPAGRLDDCAVRLTALGRARMLEALQLSAS